jgi:hypothetical protein
MNDFTDLKIDAELTAELGRIGYRRPTALQAEAVPVIARGTAAVGVASAGSGKTLAYALGLAARLDPAGPGPQALVLRPTDTAAARTADTLHRLLQPKRLTVGVVRPLHPVNAHIAVASPAAALAAVEHSAIKLDGLVALVVDGASAMVALGAAEALETLTAQAPKDAQRVLLTSALTQEVETWIDRHARRARRLAYLPTEAEPLSHASMEFYTGSRTEWLGVLVHVLTERGAKGSPRTRVHCRLEDEARALADQLQVRGLPAAASDDAVVRLEVQPAAEPADLAVAWGAPADFAALRACFESTARTAVFAEPGEIAHLARLVELAALRVTALRTTLPEEAQRSAQNTLEQLRQAASGRDLEPYMLLLEPLLDEFTPTQIAAAAAALLRERAPAEPETALPAWTRLYFGVGRRDAVRPADLVGAITGEAAVGGDSIGRIEIRDTHTSVEVAAAVAEKVIKALATATIRGRPANVRLFRD